MRTRIMLFILFITLLSCMYAEVTDNPQGVEFSYNAPNAGSVSVAGSFNNWNTSANTMQKDANGIWKTIIKLQAGKHQYKYVVDGNWNYDQDNSETADDGYGGQNSAFEVGSDGKLLKKGTATISGIKTSLNPKITFNGRYYTENVFNKNNYTRYALQKPLHDINLMPVIKFSNEFTALFVWKINNQLEGADMYKTHLKFQRSEMNLHTEVFDLHAFDNTGTIRFDDPMHFIGDEGKYHYDFGWGFRGIDLKTAQMTWKGFSPQAEGIFADGTRIADFSEGDVIAGRVTVGTPVFLKPKFGYSIMSVKIPIVDRQYNNHESFAFDMNLTDDLYNWGNVKPLRFEPFGEYYEFKNQVVDSTKAVWLRGTKMMGGMNVYFPKALTIHANYEKTELKFPTVLSRQQIYAGGEFELDRFWIKTGAEYRMYDFPDSAKVTWSDYYRYMEKTNGNGRWFQQYTCVPWERFTVLGYDKTFLVNSDIGLKFNLFNWNYVAELRTLTAQTKLSTQPKYIENIFILEWEVAKSWFIDTNTRIPFYNDEFLGLKTDIGKKRDFFWSNYTQLEYRIASNVKVAVGWGVNPYVLSSVTDDFSAKGRESFLGAAATNGNAAETQIENAYFSLGNYIRAAEKALKNEQRINVTATLSF